MAVFVDMQASDLQLDIIYKEKEASGFNSTFHNCCTVKHSSWGYKYHNRKSQKGQEIWPFPSMFNTSFHNLKIIKSANNAISMRAVQKVSDLWSAKIQLFIWMSETLIPFIIVSLVMHTLLPAVLPLLETFLESFLWNHVQQVCHVDDGCLHCEDCAFVSGSYL